MTTDRDKLISMRVPHTECNLIDRAASAAGKTRTAFVLDAARREAEDILKDRTQFHFSAPDWNRLIEVLDAPVSSTERRRVSRLLAESPMWDRHE